MPYPTLGYALKYTYPLSIGYVVSQFSVQYTYSLKLINTAYPLPLDTAANPADIFNLCISEEITTWEELVEKFFCRSIPKKIIRWRKDEDVGRRRKTGGLIQLNSCSNVNTSFKNHKKVDGRTQKVIFHAWMNGNWNKIYMDSELKDEALRNKAIMEGLINEDDDESRYKQKRQWNMYTNYDDAYEINHGNNEKEELCKVHELPACNIRRYMMIKYSLNNDEEYVAVKEDEYDDLTKKRHAKLTKKSFG
ncbi:hypothetical protein Tco_0879597 [Tanacetum coccineum]